VALTSQDTLLRVGELSKLVGVSTHVLRVWEQRYGLLNPVRSPGGYRLYSRDDVSRVRRMLELRAGGLAVSSAAKEVLAADRAASFGGRASDADGHGARAAGGLGQAGSPGSPIRESIVGAMLDAVREFDEARLQSLLDDRLRGDTFEEVLRHDLVPFLRELGEGWERGDITVAHEHFATGLIRRRMSTYTLCWGSGDGPRAVLTCPPSEHHDLMLYAFGVVLGRRGWQVRFLGADTPIEAMGAAAEPGDVVIVACSRRVVLIDHLPQLRSLASAFSVALAGAGADHGIARDIGAELLPTDVVTAVDELTRLVKTRVL
jgi:MerR family transcriptional regulator, light-induced transcriptional regulator